MPVSIAEVRRQVVLALYEFLLSSDAVSYWHDVEQILDYIDSDISGALVRVAIDALHSDNCIDVGQDDEYNPIYALSAKGVDLAEKLVKDDPEYAAQLKRSYDKSSARLLQLDHADAGYRQVADRLSDVQEAMRGLNDFDPAEHDRIIRTLIAAAELWQASQLKVVQAKVGILMAAEDAQVALIGTAKAVAASLLVDGVKSFFKTRFGLDLDHI